MASSPVRDTTHPTPREAAAAAVRVADPAFVEGSLHWLQSAPDGSGRMVLVAAPRRGATLEVSPPDASLRSRLYGYGAASWCPSPIGPLGVDARTQGLVAVADGARALDPAWPDGDVLGDPVAVPRSTWVVAACERSSGWRGLVALDTASGAARPLHRVAGRVGEPQVRHDGGALAWVEWPERAMPWDAGEVWVGTLATDGGGPALRAAARVDGGARCAAGQPAWRSDGALAYVSEAAGWAQPWVCDDGGAVRRLSARHAEFQRPRWLTCRWLAPLEGAALACAFADADGEHVGVLDRDGSLELIDQPCVRVDGVAADRVAIGWVGAALDAQGVACVAEGPDRAARVVSTGPTAAEAPTPEGVSLEVGGVALDGACWRPDRSAPHPLVVTVHPGPTGAVDRSYAPLVHLLVANGFAVASLDHSGSTAHGRAHRDRLLGRYGELDVAECVALVRHLVAEGLADPRALFARGTSAGGTTALLALEHSVLAGAVAWYPASRFEDEDEGFEAGYLADLVGPDGAGRSPLARADALRGSALVVQGAEDTVVSAAETAALVDALSRHLDEVELVTLEGEGHGFRTTAGREAALVAELAFYRRHAERPGADRPSAGRPRVGLDAVAGEPGTGRYDASTSRPSMPDADR